MLPKTLRPALRSRVALCGKSRRKPASALRLVENRLAVDKSHGSQLQANLLANIYSKKTQEIADVKRQIVQSWNRQECYKNYIATWGGATGQALQAQNDLANEQLEQQLEPLTTQNFREGGDFPEFFSAEAHAKSGENFAANASVRLGTDVNGHGRIEVEGDVNANAGHRWEDYNGNRIVEGHGNTSANAHCRLDTRGNADADANVDMKGGVHVKDQNGHTTSEGHANVDTNAGVHFKAHNGHTTSEGHANVDTKGGVHFKAHNGHTTSEGHANVDTKGGVHFKSHNGHTTSEGHANVDTKGGVHFKAHNGHTTSEGHANVDTKGGVHFKAHNGHTTSEGHANVDTKGGVHFKAHNGHTTSEGHANVDTKGGVHFKSHNGHTTSEGHANVDTNAGVHFKDQNGHTTSEGHANVDTNAGVHVKADNEHLTLEGDAIVDANAGVGLQTPVFGCWDGEQLALFTDDLEGMEAPIKGSVTLDENGAIVSGDLAIDDIAGLCKSAAEVLDSDMLEQLHQLLETHGIDGIRAFWGETFSGCSISVNGINVHLKRMTFDVSGCEETSSFEYDACGNVVHYEGEKVETEGSDASSA